MYHRNKCLYAVAAFAAMASIFDARLNHSIAQTESIPPRDVPARTLRVPTALSPQLQKIVGRPIPSNWNVLPKTTEEWKAQVRKAADTAVRGLPAVREQLHVKSEPLIIDGVRTFVLTPDSLPTENRNRLLIHFHGGCYVSNPGESGTLEGLMMAGFGHFKVISVDYRMAPDDPYPGALDDAVTVWKAALKTTDAKKMAVFGSSAGGGLTLSMILRAIREKLPLPAAIAPGTPMADLTDSGDSFYTNAFVDNGLIAPGASCDVRAGMYANGHDLNDPMLSPLFGDMHGFPPTILNTGTRDLLLSNTVRVHNKLRQAGVEVALYVHEGMTHAAWARDSTAPESKETFEEIARFFDTHLEK